MLRWHFDRVVAEGWLPDFLAAAERYEVRPELLMAIASRESEMGGPRLPDGSLKWLVMPGDGGHGYGLMQVDRRSYPEWVATEAWQQPAAGIYQGAAVVAAKRQGLMRRIGQTVSVRDRKTRHIYRFTMPPLDGALLERVAVASYNAGDWAAYHWVKRADPDYGTTGKNYSADVLGRAVLFRQWLTEHQKVKGWHA
jgi:hypothetical protein